MRDVASAPSRATRPTRNGEYHRIRHAGDLPALVDPEKTAGGCRHCRRLPDTLAEAVEAA